MIKRITENIFCILLGIRAVYYYIIMHQEIEIRKLRNADLPAVIDIADKQLGKAYIQEQDLLINDVFAYVAVTAKHITGFCTGRITTKAELYSVIPKLNKIDKNLISNGNRVGIIASMAVDPDYVGSGIGTSLMKHCINLLEDNGCQVILMTAWRSQDGVHINHIAEKFGFEKIIELSEFWKEDSLRHGYQCPCCGEPPCICTAVVYQRHT